MAKSKGYTVDQKNEMKIAYEGGVRLAPLAKQYGVSAPTMAKYIRDVGGTLRNAGTPRKVVAPQLVVDSTPGPEVNTPQAPVARRILPFE